MFNRSSGLSCKIFFYLFWKSISAFWNVFPVNNARITIFCKEKLIYNGLDICLFKTDKSLKVIILLVWKPSYQEFHQMFSNDNSLKILILLSQQEKPICAAEVAKILDIHISTAKKYLDLFTDFQFIKKEFVPTKPGKPTYYTSKRKKINISLNMANLAKTFHNHITKSSLPNPFIREKANLQPRVTYVLGEEGLVQSIVHVKRTKARRHVKQRIKLSKNESRFMKFRPHPTMQASPFIEICKKARITDFFTIKALLIFTERLRKLDIIEEINSDTGDNS